MRRRLGRLNPAVQPRARAPALFATTRDGRWTPGATTEEYLPSLLVHQANLPVILRDMFFFGP